jgi:predicted amidohydrolase
MRIHMLQVRVDLAEPIPERIARVGALAAAQKDADLIVLPELWVQGAFDLDSFSQHAESLDGPAISAMAEAARATGAWIHAGSLITIDGDGALANTAVVLDPSGTITARYDKMHLFGFEGGETAFLTAGEKLVTTEIGGLFTGMTTCYDLRFPEQYRALTDQGVEYFIIPASWPERRIAHWSALAMARAIENQTYVIAVNAVGEQGDVSLGGKSLVVDPWGAVIAEAGTDEEVLVANIDVELVSRTRAQFPVLRDRIPI